MHIFKPACLILTCLAFSATAQEAEIYIPGSQATQPSVSASPQSALAGCLIDPSAQNCAGINLDPSGTQLESMIGGSQIQLETLVLNPGTGQVTSTPQPPATKPDYTAPTPTYGTVTLPAVAITIEFDFNRADIRYDQFGKITSLVQAMKDPALQATPFAVIGHTDASGSDYYNCDLSRRRANAVAQELGRQYVLVPLYSVGFGEHVLKNTYNPRAAENRRVTFLRLPDDYASILATSQAVCPG